MTSRPDIAGCRVDDVTYDDILGCAERAVGQNNRVTITYATFHTVNLASARPDYREVLFDASIVHPDGVGIWLAARVLALPLKAERYNWADCTDRFLRECETRGWRLFFLGSTDETIRKMRQRLSQEFPNLRVAGLLNGFSDADASDVVDRLNAARPDVVWVGMGQPKQEMWVHRHREKIQAPVVQCVGDALRQVAGTKVRGPRWLRRLGFEWLARLVRRPDRYFTRYAVGIPSFLLIVVRQWTRRQNGSRP